MHSLIYPAIVLATILQRVWELFLSNRHEKILIRKGAQERGQAHYPFMVLLHALWLCLCLSTALTQDVAWESPFPFYFFIALFLLGQSFRVMAIRTLKDRWTTKVYILPNNPPINRGIYRWLSHPNYVGVVLEIFALPMIGGHLNLALVFTLANALILYVRLKVEKQALLEMHT